jgi:hypothetical protein
MTTLDIIIMACMLLSIGFLIWKAVKLRVYNIQKDRLIQICSVNPRPSRPFRSIHMKVSKLRWSIQLNNLAVETLVKDLHDYYEMDNSHDVDTYRARNIILDRDHKAFIDEAKETMRKIEVSAVELAAIILRRYENKIRAKFKSLKVIVSRIIHDTIKFKQDQGGAKDDEPSHTGTN